MSQPRRSMVPDPAAILRLTEAQCVCLRLIYRHHSSKDIARELGISPHSVDARVRAALQTLKVDNRIDAALALAAHEAGIATYQSPAYQASEVAPLPSMPPHADAGRGYDANEWAADLSDGTRGDSFGAAVREPAAAFVADYPVARMAPAFPALRFWGGRNDLTILARAGIVAVVAIGAALAFGAILAGLAALKALST